MFHYDRIDISEGITLAKSNNSKECMIWHYWFLNHGLKTTFNWIKFQDCACNCCHDLSMLCLNISKFVIINVKNVD